MAEVIEWEKALKAVAEVTAKEKGEATNSSERKVVDTEKAWLAAKKKLTDMVTKLGETKLKLAKADSLKLAQADQIASMKDALEACEDKWYNAGFSEAESAVEPIIFQARHHGFGEG